MPLVYLPAHVHAPFMQTPMHSGVCNEEMSVLR